MASYKDLTKFKLFLSDTGLFTTLMFKNKAFTENDIYKKLLSDKISANLGYLFENLTAQMHAALSLRAAAQHGRAGYRRAGQKDSSASFHG